MKTDLTYFLLYLDRMESTNFSLEEAQQRASRAAEVFEKARLNGHSVVEAEELAIEKLTENWTDDE